MSDNISYLFNFLPFLPYKTRSEKNNLLKT